MLGEVDHCICGGDAFFMHSSLRNFGQVRCVRCERHGEIGPAEKVIASWNYETRLHEAVNRWGEMYDSGDFTKLMKAAGDLLNVIHSKPEQFARPSYLYLVEEVRDLTGRVEQLEQWKKDTEDYAMEQNERGEE